MILHLFVCSVNQQSTGKIKWKIPCFHTVPHELQTLHMAMDNVLGGNLDSAADVLMQRFKAVETACHDGQFG